MRKNIILSAHEQNLKPLDWSRPVGIDCIDDRGYKAQEGIRQNLKLGGASSYGLAFDTYAARALARGRQFEAGMPIGKLAKVITGGLAQHELLANLHHGCAAELGALAIGREIVCNGERVRSKANLILGGYVEESMFEQLQEFYAVLDRDQSLFRGVAIEAADMELDGEGEYPAIKRVHLAHSDHRANTLYVNNEKDTWFDAAAAYADGDPGYHFDAWAVQPIAEKIDAIIPHDNVNGFGVAAAVRQAAISELLPRGNDTGVDIVRHEAPS